MKNYDKTKITLAIGDGGNDVSMIMEAHIGIGIYGEEGLRAAQSSDYAIGEFQVLRRLLFFHGYLNLMRNSVMVIYFFYKNFVFTIIHFFYGFLNNFSGQTIIEEWSMNFYNLIFTSIPLGVRGILDISLKPDDGKIVQILIPYLYKEQRETPIFNIRNFLLNIFKGIIHTLINYFVTIYTVHKEIDNDGSNSSLWVLSNVFYTNILMIVTIDLIIFTKYHTWLNILFIIILTYLLYILFLVAAETFVELSSSGTISYSFNSGLIWMDIILVSGTCGLIDFTILAFNQIFIKNIYHQLKSLDDKNDISYDYIKTIPKDLQQLLLADDKVKEYNKGVIINNDSNDNPNALMPKKSIIEKKSSNKLILNKSEKKISKNIIIEDINKNSEDNPIVVYSNNSEFLPPSQRKKVKKKKRKSISTRNQNPPNGTEKKNSINNNENEIDNNNDNNNNNEQQQNGEVYRNSASSNNVKEGETSKAKSNVKPFGNIKFNNKDGKSQKNVTKLSIQKDITDRNLLKDNF